MTEAKMIEYAANQADVTDTNVGMLADGDKAISLNAVIDVMHEMWGDSGELLDAIKELPPVTLQ